MNHDTLLKTESQYDLVAIEAEARRLRAAMVRDMFAAFGAWLRRIITRRPASAIRAA